MGNGLEAVGSNLAHFFPGSSANFLELNTKQGPPAPSRTPLPRLTNVAKEHLSYFDSRVCRGHNKPSRPNIQVFFITSVPKSQNHDTVTNF